MDPCLIPRVTVRLNKSSFLSSNNCWNCNAASTLCSLSCSHLADTFDKQIVSNYPEKRCGANFRVRWQLRMNFVSTTLQTSPTSKSWEVEVSTLCCSSCNVLLSTINNLNQRETIGLDIASTLCTLLNWWWISVSLLFLPLKKYYTTNLTLSGRCKRLVHYGGCYVNGGLVNVHCTALPLYWDRNFTAKPRLFLSNVV